MCGICGSIAYGNAAPPDRAAIGRSLILLRHRGPDDIGEHFDDRAGLALGHARLSIIDLACGHQPIANEDGTVVAVFNGEIYNFHGLRERLIGKGHVFRTHTDSEVLVHLYEERGEDLVEDLLGDFAFAIWSAKDRKLMLARDRLGVKPLYYADNGKTLTFASTLPAVLAGAGGPREIDPDGLFCYLAFHVIQAPRTIYRSVRKLPPGHVLTVKAGGDVRLREYWDLPNGVDESKDDDAWTQELRALLADAVRGQLLSDVPIGAFLSGGVDSSTVVHFMRQASPERVKTFSIGFDEPEYDESRYYKPLAKQWGVEHHEAIFRPNLLDDASRIVAMFGEPCSIGSAFPLYYLSALAAQHVKVVLSGDGPDEIFAGYDQRYTYLNWLWRVRRACPGPLLSAAHAAFGATGRMRTTSRLGNMLRRVRKGLETAGLPARDWLPHLMINRTDESTPAALLRPDLLHAVGEPLPYVRAFERCSQDGDWMRPFLYADIRVMLPGEMFTKLDSMTMAHSIEGRVPLCDHRIVELAWRMPSRLKFSKGRGKRIYRRAVEPLLPREIIHRPKVGFRVPFNEWFRGPMRPMAHDLLGGGALRSGGLFNEQAVERVLADHESGRQNYGGVLWSLAAFELWRRGIEGR